MSTERSATYTLLGVAEESEAPPKGGRWGAATLRRSCCTAYILLCVALVPVLLAILVFIPGMFTCGIFRVLCTLKFWVWPGTCSADFSKCLARLPLGANRIPFGYLVMSSWSLPSYVNLTGLPTSSVYDYDLIVAEARRMPEKFFSGEWWRGNELGGLVNNPYYWSGSDIWPMSISMGITEQQRSAVRKLAEEAFSAPAPWNVGWIRAGLQQFFKERAEAGRLNVMEDISIWVHQVLMNTTFNWKVDYASAKEFVKVQHDFFTYGTVSQLTPASMYSTLGRFIKMPQTRDAMAAHVSSYLPLVEDRWGGRLANADCSPSKNCTVQLASMLLDGLLSTGGQYLPYGIRSGLAVLFSSSPSNPGRGQGELVAGHEEEFFWECLRLIPPALGVPYWREARPTCVGTTAEETERLHQYQGLSSACPKLDKNPWTGYPPVNQWEGGHRYVLGILLGQQDPHIWGEGAESKFRVRTLDEYQRFSVGFNEMASNDGVNGGRSNRNCPAKQLALLLGKLFFEEFDVSAWIALDSDIPIDSRGAASAVAPFTLLPRKKIHTKSGT